VSLASVFEVVLFMGLLRLGDDAAAYAAAGAAGPSH